MKTVSITCDRCGEPANESVTVSWQGVGGDMRPAIYDRHVYDLCPTCAAGLRAWLESKEDRQ